MNKKFVWGFSLAELLIAVAIIGVIAALTIPGVIANYQRKALLTQLQKSYVELQESLLILKTENYQKGLYGSSLNKKSSTSIRNSAGKFLLGYYKITQDCETDTQPCFASKYADLSSMTYSDYSCEGYSVNVASGAAICIVPASITEEEVSDDTGATTTKEIKNPAVVYIDVNGSKEPNIGGRDMFTFNIYEDFTIDEVDPASTDLSSLEEERENLYDENCLTSSIGKGCFAKILNDDWEMNY